MRKVRNQTLGNLLKKIEEKTIAVGVVGLGYVGLPFLLEKAKVGLKVVGIDHNPERVSAVAQGTSYIDDVRSEELKAVVAQGIVTTMTNYDLVGGLDVIVICVPTPLSKNLCPDLQFVESVAEALVPHLRPGQLISLESTTYPGTTEEVIQPILEKSGLQVGFDFFLAHSPERVDPGNKRYTTKNTNKIVGGVNQTSLQAAEAFYRLSIDEVVTVSSAQVAELVKVYENTYRAVNIALANEIAMLCDCMDINVWEVLDAAFTKPFGIMPFYPGPGVGGHCIPVDPHYLEWKAKEYGFQTRFIALAGEINRRMPQFVVHKVSRKLNDAQKSLNGSRILMLGMSYKKNVSDYRESPALVIYTLLEEAGCLVDYHDSWVPEVNCHGVSVRSIALTDKAIAQADLVLIATAHECVDYLRVIDRAQSVFDTRNVTRNFQSEMVASL